MATRALSDSKSPLSSHQIPVSTNDFSHHIRSLHEAKDRYDHSMNKFLTNSPITAISDDGVSASESFYTAYDSISTASPISMESCKESNYDPALLHFEVFWCDLGYEIQPKISASNLLSSTKNKILSIFNNRNNSHNGEKLSTESNLYKTIFKGLNGSFKSGQSTAVMGPSGAGKTSLLNCLSRRITNGYSGYIGVTNSKQRKLKISTIPQKDYLLEYLTVRENLMFASRLKNMQSNFDHDLNIERVASLLGIYDCLDTRTKKISGGQCKRVSIAQELLSKPDILILDEPTSGLDSLTCYRTICVLRDLARMSSRRLIDPIAIIFTIHQPQREVFDLFDKIYMMATGGHAIYDGPPNECVEFIEAKTHLKIPDTNYNPASFMIEIASGECGQRPIIELEKFNRRIFEKHRNFLLNDLKEELEIDSSDMNNTGDNNCVIGEESKVEGSEPTTSTSNSKLASYFGISKNSFIRTINSNRDNNTSLGNGSPVININKMRLEMSERLVQGASMSKGNFWRKTWLLTHRTWISIVRDPLNLTVRILFHILCPLSMAFMFGPEPGRANACSQHLSQVHMNDLLNDKDLDKISELQEEYLLTLEYSGSQFILFFAMASAAIGVSSLSFTLSMQSSLKEFHNGWYSMSSYLLGKTLADIPVEISMPVLSICIAYPLSDQPSSPYQWRMMVMALAMVLGSLISQTVGLIFGTIFIGNVQVAMFSAQGACLPFVFLSGFLVRTKRMSKLLYLMSYTSFYRLTSEIVILARYGFGICSCDPAIFANGSTKLVGVPRELRAYTQYYFDTMSSSNEDQEDDEEEKRSKSNLTSTLSGGASIMTPSLTGAPVNPHNIPDALITNSTLSYMTNSSSTFDRAVIDTTINETSIANTTANLPATDSGDIYELFAKQISLAHSYGIDVQSCDDVRPYQLYELSLRESQLGSRIMSLVMMVVVLRLLLFVIVKLVTRYRSSL